MTEAALAVQSPHTDRALVVINPGAPKHEAGVVRAAIELAASRHGIPCRIVEMPAGDGAPAFVSEHVSRAIHEGWERVVVAGGDGTVSMVAACLARGGDHETRLGIVAGGTTNGLAKELGLPDDLEEAVAVALESDRALELDAIRAGDRYYWTQVGIGPDAVMIRETSAEERRRLGRLAYVVSYLKRAFRQRRSGFRIEVDGHPMRLRASQIMVANAGTAGGSPSFTWGPKIDPTDGVLELCVFDVQGLLDHLRLLWRSMTGHHRQDTRTRFFRVHREVRIESDFPTPVQGDGEVLGRTPITLTVAMHAVKVVVAREVEATEEGSAAPAVSERAPAAAVAEPAAQAEAAAVAPKDEKATGAPAPEPDTVAADVETMVAQRSRTWVLQGVLKHPATWLQALDAAIFLRVNNLVLGTVLDRGLEGVSRMMHYGEGWAIAALALISVDFHTGIRATAEALPVLWLTMLTVNLVLKSVFRRRRPFVAYVKARVLGPRPKDFSFPSGHTAAAFGGAFLLSAHAPGWAPVFFAIATLVGFSRVYLGVHYPGDVLFGGAAGVLIALGYRTILRLVFPALG